MKNVEEAPPAKVGQEKNDDLGVGRVLLLGGGGGAAWFWRAAGMKKTPTRVGMMNMPRQMNTARTWSGDELEPFRLKFGDRDELRFLKVSIKLELDRPEETTDYQAKVPAIRMPCWCC